MIDMKTEDLYLEYARVIKMCEGTALEGKPWECVLYTGEVFFKDHPRFDQNPEDYDFAVAILEDKPVFVGDLLCHKTSGAAYQVKWCSDSLIKLECKDHGVDREPDYLHMEFTWTPPIIERTFVLNGQELPCPVSFKVEDRSIGYYFTLDGYNFFFEKAKDKNKTRDALFKLLFEARDKE